MNKIFKYCCIIIAIIQSQGAWGMQALWTKQKAVANAIPKEPQTPEDIKAAQLGVRKELGHRSLIILFDPNNDDQYRFNGCRSGGAMTYDFDGALQSHVPIITSAWFLHYAINCETIKPYLKNWDVYKISIGPYQAMYVFIPNPNQTYLAKINDYTVYQRDKQKNVKNMISDGQLILGMKLKNDMKIEPGNFYPLSLLPNQPLEDLKACLNQILVTNADLKRAGIDEGYINTWDIYLTGHGSSKAAGYSKSAIAAVPIEDFKNLLDFLNLGISTRSLFYSSCFSGGTNLEDTYQYAHPYVKTIGEGKKVKRVEQFEVQDKDFNYMIISANAFGTTTSAQELNADSFDQYFDRLSRYLTRTGEQTVLDKQTNKPVPLTLDRVISSIYAWDLSFERADSIKKSFKSNEVRLELPTVRLAHADRFVLTSSDDKRVFTINDGTIERVIYGNKKEIIIPKETKMIVLQSRYIPVPIVIEGYPSNPYRFTLTPDDLSNAKPTVPIIVPQEPDKDYFFKEIRAEKCYLEYGQVGLQSALYTLNNKINKTLLTGTWYIEKLRINCADMRDTYLEKQFGTPILDLKNVIIKVPEQYMMFHLTPPESGLKPLSEYSHKPHIWNGKDPFIYPYSDWITQPNLYFINDTLGKIIIGKKASIDNVPKRLKEEEELMPKNIEAIRKASKLPESMKGEKPQPVFALPTKKE